MRIKYNHDWIKEINGIKYFPTRFKVADYVTEDTILDTIDNISIPSPREFEINMISDKINFGGLLQSKQFPFLDTKHPFSDKIIEKIKKHAPEDKTEIVGWMQETGSINALLDARCEEYNQNSHLVSKSGDGKIPGVSIEDLRFEHFKGYDVVDRGYSIAISPYGNINVPNNSGKSIIFKDYLAWGAVNAHKTFQYNATLLKWKELAKSTIDKPIKNIIGFFSWNGLTAPHFFTQDPEKEVKNTNNVIIITSSEEQKINIKFRDPTDYTNVLDKGNIKVEEGQFEIMYGCASYPYVPPVVVEIQPEKPTSLDRFEVK